MSDFDKAENCIKRKYVFDYNGKNFFIISDSHEKEMGEIFSELKMRLNEAKTKYGITDIESFFIICIEMLNMKSNFLSVESSVKKLVDEVNIEF
jgi:hypothetical protein